MVRAESVPKSATWPPESMSTRMLSPRIGWLLGPRASTVTVDCDDPSSVIVSGVAWMLRSVASVEGPASAGASVSLTVHASGRHGHREGSD